MNGDTWGIEPSLIMSQGVLECLFGSILGVKSKEVVWEVTSENTEEEEDT